MPELILGAKWVPKDILPAQFVIVAAEPKMEATKWGNKQYVTIMVEHATTREIYDYDVKYKDLNYLANTISKTTEHWLGKTISIVLDSATGYKRVELP